MTSAHDSGHARADEGHARADEGSARADEGSAAGAPGRGYVDWGMAKATARRLVPPGPRANADQIAELVGDLRQAAQRSQTPVAETARLQTPDGGSPVLVVDRTGWIDANVDSLQSMLDPVIRKITAKQDAKHPGQATAGIRKVGGKVTGGEAGALMAFLAGKVLGQYDIAPQGNPRLLLVAPNVMQTERELDVVPADFRLWVCMHEETHRVQFTAVPWLREHVIESARRLSLDLVPDIEQLPARLQQIARSIPDVVRGTGNGLVDLFASPEQRAELAKITAVMSLLEGHADVVMDDVGPQVIPTVAQIRARFQVRRRGSGSVDRVLRRLLGLDAKMRQYRDGARFVREVTEQVGVDGFNAVWTSPETLPLPTEIEQPRDWVARVHG
ncbi:MAG TPA: zinc-dependent metalloprotease [Segeticoccus sp.]|uniref:zinc-dependent metalloprotease n=1 Tax=Segeticoccus sp. TaxID=2706531 RepID=UPI002D7E3F46|nr:zinc-dependent metalloprotease [Segeticoccus sp.]HET8599059.1 zinc-dependent metalloprotease [Segeticoccus sp.]